MFTFIFLTILLMVYFMPTIVANCLDRERTGIVFAINLLTGWTILGWVAALVLAVALPARVRPHMLPRSREERS